MPCGFKFVDSACNIGTSRRHDPHQDAQAFTSVPFFPLLLIAPSNCPAVARTSTPPGPAFSTPKSSPPPRLPVLSLSFSTPKSFPPCRLPVLSLSLAPGAVPEAGAAATAPARDRAAEDPASL